MRVFISWSGDRSKAVAEVLKSWIRVVIQGSDPWLSTQDIGAGGAWGEILQGELDQSTVGIFCLTPESKNSLWMHYEAGAVAKGLPEDKLERFVCPLLIEMEGKEVTGPLSKFNYVEPTRLGMFRLAESLNSARGKAAIATDVLQESFDAHWEKFEKGYKGAIKNHHVDQPAPERQEEDVLGEILESVRALDRRTRQLESSGYPRVQKASPWPGGRDESSRAEVLQRILDKAKKSKPEMGNYKILSNHGSSAEDEIFSTSDVLRILHSVLLSEKYDSASVNKADDKETDD